MQAENTRLSWGTPQQVLHWIVAILVICQLTTGLAIAMWGDKGVPDWATVWHPSIGLTIALLMIARLVLRETNPVPDEPADLSPGLQMLSRGTHYMFYAILIGNPLGGYLLTNLLGYPVKYFGLTMPTILGKDAGWAALFAWAHGLGALALLLGVTVHIAGALSHEFSLRDNVLRRMLSLAPMTPERQARQDTPPSEPIPVARRA